MINIGDLRTLLEGVAASALPDVAIYLMPAVDGMSSLPAIVLGMPSWDPGQNPCLERMQISVSVVVARPGVDETATVAELESLWPVLLEAIKSAINAGVFDAVATQAEVVRSRFGDFKMREQTLPGQSIDIDFHG